MYDRLIELIKRAEDIHMQMALSGTIDELIDLPNKEETIADHLLANGVIVPPCKVGDTVYELYDMQGCRGITEHIVTNVAISMNPTKRVVYTKNKQYEKSKDIFCDDKFGITLFFTREEAERALREEDEGK